MAEAAIEGLFYVSLQVSDLDRSRAFYRDGLGWRLHTAEPGVAGLWFGSGYVILLQDQRPADQRAYPGGTEISVRVTDIEGEHSRLQAAGVAPSPVESKPWGERSFAFRDPDGYRWLYGQPAG